jgi:hypothetical protein
MVVIIARIAVDCFGSSAARTVAHKLSLNKNGEEQVLEFADIEEVFNAAMPWVMEGYIARITEKHGVVQYTQALTNGQSRHS